MHADSESPDPGIIYVDPRPGRGTGRAALICALILLAGVVAIGLAFAIASGGDNLDTFAYGFTTAVLPALLAVIVALLVATIVLAIISLLRSHSTLRRPAILALVLAVASALAYSAWLSVLGGLLADYTP